MNVVLSRIGIDTGCGGIHGPLFADGTFEYIPIPDGHAVDERTYGNTLGRHGRKLIDYFPAGMRDRMADQPMHVDPEFQTFTYGDPTGPKAGLRHLKPGDLLVFYCGLRGWGLTAEPALYLMGFFEIERAGRATDFTKAELNRLFSCNFHVRHRRVLQRQRKSLVLVKGTANSRLLESPVRISVDSTDRAGNSLKVLAPDMRRIFGDFGGHVSIQRSPPRWVAPAFTAKAADFVTSIGRNGSPRPASPRVPSRKQDTQLRGASDTAEPKVYLVHLHRPDSARKNPGEKRDDPFYEFGSFGCTKCHSKNLLHPNHARDLEGARLAFVQGGRLGSRLVFLTPPITVKKWAHNCELRWTPAEMPFKYKEEPTLVSNNGYTDFPSVKQFALHAAGGKIEGCFSSRIRSRARPLEPRLAREVVKVYEEKRAKAAGEWPSVIAATYDEALPWKPPKVDRNRKATYRFLIAQRQGETDDLEGALRTEALESENQTRCDRPRRRKSCHATGPCP